MTELWSGTGADLDALTARFAEVYPTLRELFTEVYG